MSTFAALSFHSPTILAQQLTAAAFTEVPPWRAILAVEPDIAVLHEKSLLLTQADYRVTRATSDREIFTLRGTKAVPLAILSDPLGQRLLGTGAAAVRRQWRRTRILILGQVPRLFEDSLYDEQIQRSSDPQQVLADLESLYRGMWNQRSNTLDWNASRLALCFVRPPILESDPTKTVKPAPVADQRLHDMPADIRLPITRPH